MSNEEDSNLRLAAEWTDERWDQLKLLEELISQCRAINLGSHVVERLDRIGKLAEELNYSNPHEPFICFSRFLMNIATKR
tara:strand:+ start:350 stop:589 length:240 start_codon:yes stop_codon:yes gene_type:complete